MSENDFGSVPRITIDNEDVGRHRHQKQTVPASGAKIILPSWRILGLVGTILAIGFIICGAFIFHLKNKQEATRQELLAAVARLETLEAKLASTDTTITKSEVLLAGKLKSMDEMIATNKSEVKKLWAGLERNSRAIDMVSGQTKQHAASLQEISPKLERVIGEAARVSSRLESVDGLVREAGQRMEVIQENSADILAKQKLLIEKTTGLESNFSGRLGALEDSARSTDVFRRNTLDELRKIRDELTMKAGSPINNP